MKNEPGSIAGALIAALMLVPGIQGTVTQPQASVLGATILGPVESIPVIKYRPRRKEEERCGKRK
jgi:predicted membrane protein